MNTTKIHIRSVLAVKLMLPFFFLLIGFQSLSQQNEQKFVIRTYGLPSWDDYDKICDSISKKWNIFYRAVAGCVVTDQFVDSIEHLNDITYQRLEEQYGQNWKADLKKEIDAAYNLFEQKQENTFETIAVCDNSSYYFMARRNLSGKQTKIDIVAHQTGNRKENNVKITGLQNVDPNVVYRGFTNKVDLEFGVTEDTLSLNLKYDGSFYLLDSCITSNTIHFRYFATSSDTLFIDRSNGESIQYIFKVKSIGPPNLAINNQVLDSVFQRNQWKDLNTISVELDKSVLIEQTFSIENWEIIAGRKSYKGAGNSIPLEVSKKLKKLKLGTNISLYTLIRSSDGVLRKKMTTFTLI